MMTISFYTFILVTLNLLAYSISADTNDNNCASNKCGENGICKTNFLGEQICECHSFWSGYNCQTLDMNAVMLHLFREDSEQFRSFLPNCQGAKDKQEVERLKNQQIYYGLTGYLIGIISSFIIIGFFMVLDKNRHDNKTIVISENSPAVHRKIPPIIGLSESLPLRTPLGPSLANSPFGSSSQIDGLNRVPGAQVKKMVRTGKNQKILKQCVSSPNQI